MVLEFHGSIHVRFVILKAFGKSYRRKLQLWLLSSVPHSLGTKLSHRTLDLCLCGGATRHPRSRVQYVTRTGQSIWPISPCGAIPEFLLELSGMKNILSFAVVLVSGHWAGTAGGPLATTQWEPSSKESQFQGKQSCMLDAIVLRQPTATYF